MLVRVRDLLAQVLQRDLEELLALFRRSIAQTRQPCCRNMSVYRVSGYAAGGAAGEGSSAGGLPVEVGACKGDACGAISGKAEPTQMKTQGGERKTKWKKRFLK